MNYPLLLLATVVLIAADKQAEQGPPKPPELAVLERFVGTWDSETVLKPAEWTPKEVRLTGTNKYEWVLDGRFMQDTEEDALGWWTYDTRAKAYRGWFFVPEGNVTEWKGRWNDEAKGLEMEADLGNGISFTGINRFPDKDTYEWTLVAKDKSGKVYLDMRETHRRRTKALGDKPKEKAGPPKPPELKMLERYIGNWTTETVKKPAEWTPKEERMTGTLTNEWLLDRRFVQQRGKESNGMEHVQMKTYDPQRKQYRLWHFDTAGTAADSTGKWDEDSKTMTWSSERNGITGTNVVRFVGNDAIEWNLVAKDRGGKLYLDMGGRFSRRK